MFQGFGDDMDGMLDFMEEESILDPFVQWLGWFADKGEEEVEGQGESEDPEEMDNVIKQTLTPTLIRIIRHARMREHGRKQIKSEKLIPNQNMYFLELEKHCPPPNYWGIGPQHRLHCKTIIHIWIHASMLCLAGRGTAFTNNQTHIHKKI